MRLDLRDVSLHTLQVFMAVEEAGSMTEAAARLGASRSAVSQQVSNLEAALGARLFDRTARPVALTPIGTVLRMHARRILDAVSEAQAELMELSLASSLDLKLGIIDDLDASITPELVILLRQRYPRCQMTATSGRSDILNRQLVNREADIVLTGLMLQEGTGYDDFPVLREPFMLVAPKGLLNPLDNVRRQMEEHPFIRYNKTMPIGQAITQHLRRLRIELPAPCSFDASRSVFATMVKCGGWTITTPLCLLDSHRARDQMDCLPLPFAGLTRTLRILARQDELGELPRQLASVVRQQIREAVAPQVAAVAPCIAAEFTILGDDGEALMPPGASGSAAEGC